MSPAYVLLFCKAAAALLCEQMSPERTLILVDGLGCVNSCSRPQKSSETEKLISLMAGWQLLARQKERSAAAIYLAAARFRRDPKCVDQTAGSSGDTSGRTVAYPDLNSPMTQSERRCHSALPFPVLSEQRTRSGWDRLSSFGSQFPTRHFHAGVFRLPKPFVGIVEMKIAAHFAFEQ